MAQTETRLRNTTRDRGLETDGCGLQDQSHIFIPKKVAGLATRKGSHAATKFLPRKMRTLSCLFVERRSSSALFLASGLICVSRSSVQGYPTKETCVQAYLHRPFFCTGMSNNRLYQSCYQTRAFSEPSRAIALPQTPRRAKPCGMHVCIYVCRYLCMYVGINVCMYVCMHACMHVCMCVCS